MDREGTSFNSEPVDFVGKRDVFTIFSVIPMQHEVSYEVVDPIVVTVVFGRDRVISIPRYGDDSLVS